MGLFSGKKKTTARHCSTCGSVNHDKRNHGKASVAQEPVTRFSPVTILSPGDSPPVRPTEPENLKVKYYAAYLRKENAFQSSEFLGPQQGNPSTYPPSNMVLSDGEREEAVRYNEELAKYNTAMSQYELRHPSFMTRYAELYEGFTGFNKPPR